MNTFEFYNPVKVVFGKGEVAKAGIEGAKLGKKALLVSYKEHGFFADLLASIESQLKENGVEAVPFYEVTANPLLCQVEAGVELAKAEGTDFVIGIGGGSAMDAAKCIAAGVLYKDELCKMIATSHTGADEIVFPAEALPLMMIPTLPATGSEMNCCGVITNERTNKKSYVWDNCLYPQVSIVDPELTQTLPPFQTACGAADTISHVLEFYLNGLEGTPLNNRIQEGVVLTVMENLPKLLENPADTDARANLQWSSIVALNGWSQPGDAWTPMHQLGHVLSARHNVTHGASLSVVMPNWMKHMYKSRPERYHRFATNIFNVDATGKTEEEVILEGINCFEKFLTEIGCPTSLNEVNIPATEIEEIASDVVSVSFNSDGVLPGHTEVTKADLKAIFTNAVK